MNPIIGAVVSVVVGGVLAGLASFGLVTSQTATPAPVNKPYIVYGTQG